MAFDRHTANNKQPYLPRLANASSTKSPITPRLAAQHLRASPSPSVVSQPGRVAPKTAVLARDDANTPVRSLLNSNITPRSSHRKSRIETGSSVSTPSGTPLHSPLPDAASQARSVARSTGVAASEVQRRPRSVVFGGSSADALSTTEGALSAGISKPSSFFHASDVATTERQARPQPAKNNSFFYANGDQEQAGRSVYRSPSPVNSAVSVQTSRSQFQYADGTEEHNTRVTATTYPDPRPQLSRNQSSTNSFPMRPPSPQKSNFHLTFRKGVSQVLPNRSPVITSPPSVPVPSSPRNKRRSTIESRTETPQGHARTSSLSSLDTTPSTRKTSPSAADLPLRQQYTRNSPTVLNQSVVAEHISSYSAVAEHNAEESSRPGTGSSFTSQQQISLAPTSPTQSVAQVPANFAEAAANARRERKVLDLEISNSSLLAINRQLEREVRRQKMELRRFRRLSRAGRLSSIGSIIPDHEGSQSEEEPPEASEENLSDNDESPDLSSLSEESASSDMLAHSDAARLQRDEKRLKLDLDRHRQLLVDSQKMNQSLKRCMAWTEEMIREGKKALAYKINVSDVQLGGRVLQDDDAHPSEPHDAPDDAHNADDTDLDMPETRQGLLGSWSPSSATTPLSSLASAADGLFGLVRKPPDAARDSGVDVGRVDALLAGAL